MKANQNIIIDSISNKSKYVKELEDLLEEAAKELYDYKVTFGNIQSYSKFNLLTDNNISNKNNISFTVNENTSAKINKEKKLKKTIREYSPFSYHRDGSSCQSNREISNRTPISAKFENKPELLNFYNIFKWIESIKNDDKLKPN